MVHYRVVYGFWIIILVIFVNAYKGIAITEISSPLPGKRVDSFEDLVYFQKSECSFPADDYCFFSELGSKTMRNHYKLGLEGLNYKIYSHPLVDTNGTSRENNFQFFLHNKYFDMIRHHKQNKYTREDFLLNVFREIQLSMYGPPFPTEFFIENQITKCEKDAFVDWEGTTLAEYGHISQFYPNIKLFLSKDTVGVTQRGWFFEHPTGPVPQMFKVLLQSGIYNVICKYVTKAAYTKRLLYTKSRNNASSFDRCKSMYIHHSIQTVFYISLVGCGLSIIVFLYEYLKYFFIIYVKRNRALTFVYRKVANIWVTVKTSVSKLSCV